MDFSAGLPILGASLAAMLLLSWLTLQRRWLEGCARLYVQKPPPEFAARLSRNSARLRKLALAATCAAPAVMMFRGQLAAHEISNLWHGLPGILAPLASACFAAAVMAFLIVTPLAVHATYCQLLELFRAPPERREYW